MIKFFRHIRQRMIKENRVSKYLLYAIGEIVLVVIGILIALQINTWNEERKLEDQKQILISSLLEDFEYNRSNIRDDRIPTFSRGMDDMELFFELIKADTARVSVDSLRQLGVSFFTGYSFNANLSSLNEASSSGKLSMLDNKELMQAFTQFQLYNDTYRDLDDEQRHTYFNGSSWEIRKTVPPDFLAGSNDMPHISYKEYKQVMDKPLTQTALYNNQLLLTNKKRRLEDMLKSTEKIIATLKKMQE